MPFFMARAPVRGGRVYAFRFRAAAGECSSGLAAPGGWLKRFGFERVSRDDQPYFMPRVCILGRRESGRRKEGGSCTRVGSFGAMLYGEAFGGG